MGVLRDRMAVDLGLRGLSPVTQRIYLRCAERFAAYHRRPTMTEATKQLVPAGHPRADRQYDDGDPPPARAR